MIEAIIAYIQDKGYTVRVMPGNDFMPGVLIIEKQVLIRGEARLIGYHWCIPRHDLRDIPKEWFFEQADRYLAEIEQAIQNAL
jgi:hypothetical protein